MTLADKTALVVLTEVTKIVAEVDGPISARVASGLLLAVSGVVQERRQPISLRTLEAMMGLMVALKEDVMA